MSAFRFGMQRLLGYRNTQEEEAKRELGLRRQAMEEEMARLGRLKQQEEDFVKKWREQLQDRVELPRLQLAHDYSRALDNQMERQARDLARSEDRLEQQREVARQCWQKKRMLEVLKDKARLEHQRQEQVRERLLIDEIVLNNYNRKGGENDEG